MIIQRFNLNLIPNQSPVIVHVNQYDTGIGRLIATLYEGNEPYSPNGTAVIQGTKPDGHGFQYTATLEGNVVTADLTEQMSPVAGDVRAQIVVTESSGVTGTFVFIMRVQPSALPSDTDMSESDYQYIEEAIREAQEAVETAQEAVERAQEAIAETQENAETSEAWAQGTRGGIPVEPTDPTYEHNAEYWAQYAERYAQGGLHYKGSIPFADIPTTGMREGDMYNITDDFTTDSRFEEGAGIEVKGGTNIAWNSDNKWDVLALPPKTTFNGRSGSILPMAGDYDSKKILLSSALHIGGETQNDVQEALEALSDDGVKSFNGRSGSVLPIAGDYDSEKILLASVLHIGGETQENAQEALEALENNKADRVDNAIADNFAGLDANGNLKDSGKKASDFATPSDIAGQQSLLKDTVGWTGKNLFNVNTVKELPTGVVLNKTDMGIQVRNTVANTWGFASFWITHLPKNKDYIVSCNVLITSGKGKILVKDFETQTSIFDVNVEDGEAFTRKFNTGNYNSLYITVYCATNTAELGDVTYNNLMLRKADITDPTYEPYHESVETMYEEEIHGVNLLKNEATTQTINGVTFTVNADKSVTVNGTATAQAIFWLMSNVASERMLFDFPVILSGMPSGGSNTTFAFGGNSVGICTEPTEYPANTSLSVAIVVYSGYTANNLVFKPMLRKADIEDSTYRPYNPQAIQNQLNAQGVLGAKNLIPYPYTVGTTTNNGITFTVNSDGTVVANGTSTAFASIAIRSRVSSPLKLPTGRYTISGGVSSNQRIAVGRTYNGAWQELAISSGNEASFNVSESDDIGISIEVTGAGITVNNAVFKPMIRLASDPDNTYQPYTMTNRELTEVKNVTVTAGANVTLNVNTNVFKVGKIVSGRLRLEFTGTLTVQQVLATLSDKPVVDTYAIGIENDTNKVMPVIILSNGRVLLFGSNLPTTNNHLIIPVNFITA